MSAAQDTEPPLSQWARGHGAIEAIVERLRQLPLPTGGSRKCSVQASLRGLPQRHGYPLIAVLPEAERGRAPVTRTGRTVQMCSTTIAIMTVVQMINDPGGRRAHDRLDDLLSFQRECLSGWLPPDCPSPLLWVSGAIQSLDTTAAVWTDRWRLDWYATHTEDA